MPKISASKIASEAEADTASRAGPSGWLPDWLPAEARLYLDHTVGGLSLRELARREGCHASTVLRRVQRFENRRDDPLVDEALTRLGLGRGAAAGAARADPAAAGPAGRSGPTAPAGTVPARRPACHPVRNPDRNPPGGVPRHVSTPSSRRSVRNP